MISKDITAKQLLDALSTMPDRALPMATAAMSISVKLLSGRLKQYPAETTANQPGRVDKNGESLGYYERHRGWWYPVKRIATLPPVRKKTRGARMIKNVEGVVGYKLAKNRNGKPGTSEFLGQKWTDDVRRSGIGVVGVVGNTASYAPYVEGPRDLQSAAMSAIGWVALDDALAEVMPDIDRAFGDAVDQLLASM